MNSSLNGIVLAFAGAVAASVGFILLASVSGGEGPCWALPISVSNCVSPIALSHQAYYFAVTGSALITIGVWESGIGRERIVPEGAILVLVTGLVVLGLGFLAISLPNVSFFAAEIGYVFGLLGGAMMIGGVAKLQSGQERISNHPMSIGR